MGKRLKNRCAVALAVFGLIAISGLMLAVNPAVAQSGDVVVWDFEDGAEEERYDFSDLESSEADVDSDNEDGAVKPGVVLGTDERNHVFGENGKSPTDDDHGPIVRITNGGNSLCTGTLVSEYHVLTAGHCVVDGGSGNGWTSDVEVAPASDVSTGPGYEGDAWTEGNAQFWPSNITSVKYARSYTEWVDSGDADYDMALLTLEEKVGDEYMEYTGYPDDADIWDDGTEVDITGYPASEQTGTASGVSQGTTRASWGEMWTDSGPTTGDNPRWGTPELSVSYQIDTAGGQSGSCVVNNFGGPNEECIGVHAYGGVQAPDGHNHGPKITTSSDIEDDREQHLDTWIAEDKNGQKSYSINPSTDSHVIFDEIRSLSTADIDTWFPSGPRGFNGITDVFYGGADEYNEPEAADEALIGGSAKIEHDVRNVGTEQRTFDVTYYISESNSDATPDNADHILGTTTHTLDRYEYETASFDGTVPFDVDPGTYHVFQAFERDGSYVTHRHGEMELSNPSVDIDNFDRNAGSFDNPRPITVVVDIGAGEDIFDTDELGKVDITVGQEEVDPSNVTVRGDSYPPGLYGLDFKPPAQSGPGTYNLTVGFENVDNDTAPDAIIYSQLEATQTASSLQIDRSGSMGGIMDEAREGAVTYVEQAKDEDYISIVSYSGSSTIDKNLVQLKNNRQDVVNTIEGLTSGGSTNIGDAMTDGLQTLQNSPAGVVKAGVLMTDGNTNSGPSESDILNNIVPQYNNRNICLYTIGFTSGADEQFMQQIADASDCGEYRFAGESGEVDSIQNTLQAVFRDIEGDVAGTETLSSETGTLGASESTTNQFGVDDTVIRVTANIRLAGADLSSTVTANEDSTGTIQINDVDTQATDEIALFKPDGTEVDASDSGVGVSIVGDSIIYRIEDPESGKWSYEIQNTQANSSEYSAEISGDAQATLDVTTLGDTYYVGDEADISATLVGPDGGISGATVEAVVTRPDDTTTTITLEEDASGVYTGALSVGQAGEYTASVTAEEGDLTRTKDTSWQVNQTAPISLNQSGSSDIVQGETGTFDIVLDPDSGPPENVTLSLSSLEATSGSATVPNSGIKIKPQTVVLDGTGTPQSVNATVTVPDDVPSGEYEGTVRVFREDGSVVSETVNVTVVADANFAVDIVGTNAPIEQGGELEVTFEIQNTGDVAGQQEVGVSAGGTNSTTVSLAANSSTTETLSVQTDQGGRISQATSGNLSVAVLSDDDTKIQAVQVIRPATFEVSIDSAKTDMVVTVNRDVVVNAVVTNVGDRAGTQNVTINIGNQTEQVTSTQLNGSEDRVVNLTYPINVSDDGKLVRITTENNTLRSSTGRSINVLFTEPLIQDDDFVGPAQNLPPSNGGLDDELVEDLTGDGDGTDIDQSIDFFGEIFRAELNNKDLGFTEKQARALNWDDDSPRNEVTINDAIALFGKQFRAQLNS